MDKLKVVDAAYGRRALIDRLPVLRGRGRLLLQPVPMRMRIQVLRLQHVRMPPRVGHLFRPARRRRALLLRLLLVSLLPLGDG